MTSSVETRGGRFAVEARDVSVPAGGLRLAGVLRVPAETAAPAPAIVLTGPFTGVKEQVTGHYAQGLAAAGFVTLAFDHRNFGASEGEPRQHEDSAGKLADLRAATSWLAAHELVDPDRIGCVGICLGGGYALRHSAFDPRIRALAVVAAAFNDPRAMQEGMGAQQYRGMMASFAAAKQEQFTTGRVDYLPAVSGEPGGEAAMGGAEPFAYYGTARSASPGWENRVTRLSIRELLTFDAAVGADFLGPTPALVVHGRRDEYCSPAAAEAIHARLTGPRELVWLDTTNHIDLYDQAQYVDPAVRRVAEWMGEHL
ncbi:hypothetical protein CLV92_10421 [Kineococcus xinjiangensis]|uniref:Xaa-Pro dipeptidyl-peptidase-like domain-containing protein n=1 Tax=Kineococcus xinjiangensis TaxID=512762 RepID=A0A2S6IT32_9ACTN|nr:alpha/beta hydrolase [Kineococcus xinjiangensis]PPK97206.1 hypothetical protein CLV92_10421 [Kineococcus xinjiangensis]